MSRRQLFRGLVAVVRIGRVARIGRFARAADHDLLGLDRDADLAMPGPVLGVVRVVLDGWVEPESKTLIAVVEGRFNRALATPPAAATASPAATAPRPTFGLAAV